MRGTLFVALAAAALAQTSNGPSLQIFNCSDTAEIAKNQIWTVHSDNTITLNSTGLCIDVDNYAIADQSEIWTYTCHQSDKNPAHQNQAWSVNANGTITEIMSGSCMDVSGYGVDPGSQVWLYHCTGGANQQWTLQPVTGMEGSYRIVGAQSGLCLDGGTTMSPCNTPGVPAQPFCNTTLSIDERADLLVAAIPDDQKPGLFDTTSSGVPSLFIGPYQWWSEALHGVAYSPGVTFGDSLPGATSFPQVATTAMAWNRTLWSAIGTTVGTEARVFNNLGQAGLTFWTPNINIFRGAQWGRGQETPGEDPYVNGQYAAAYISNLQTGDDPRYLRISSCSKHYAAYSLEQWNGTDRHHFNAVVTDQDEADTYLPAFQSAVEVARVSSIMCSYNEVNGIPSCANSFLLNEVARQEWQFSGYITSDCGAVTDIIDSHHYTTTADATVGVTLNATMDIGCDGFIPPALNQALTDGAVTMDAVDASLTNLFRVRLRLGEFDPADIQPYKSLTAADVCTNASQALALDAANQGMTLLKNTIGKGLPLSTSAVKTLAVIGPNAQATQIMQGNYYGAPCSSIVSPVVALQAFASVNYVQGCAIATANTSGIPAAVAAAASADATVLIVGIDQSQESEGHDRDNITFPGVQEQLITQVCAASKGPCIVVVMGGGSLDLTAEVANADVAAILWTGYPGEAGGVAIAQTLFGVSKPAGRLVQTIYPGHFATDVSFFEMNMRPGPSIWPPFTSPGRTYRFYTGTPVFEFGFGLAYTTFTYGVTEGPREVSSAPVSAYLARHPNHGSRFASLLDNPIVAEYNVSVTNTGDVDSDDVVIGFLAPPGAGTNGIPLQQTFNFERVFVPAGKTVYVWLGLTARDLTQVNAAGVRLAHTGEYTVRFGVKSGHHVEVPLTVTEA